MLQEQLSEGLWNWYPYGSEADIVKIESEEELMSGDFARVRITGALVYDLMGEII